MENSKGSAQALGSSSAFGISGSRVLKDVLDGATQGKLDVLPDFQPRRGRHSRDSRCSKVEANVHMKER